jgi:hypothetical protein
MTIFSRGGKMDKTEEDKIKFTIQDCNINFLIGSGLSAPYLETLGNIEVLLTELDEQEVDQKKKDFIKISLYKKYFEGVVFKNLKILADDEETKMVLKEYCIFINIIQNILLRRKSTILGKELNLFTTNIDIFLEKALDNQRVEYNDGFIGKFKPMFDSSNFNKSHFKKSRHFDNIAELPTFNLFKLHGSILWEQAHESKEIYSSCDLKLVKEIAGHLDDVKNVLQIDKSSTIETLLEKCEGKTITSKMKEFISSFDKLLVVNPTKEKFKSTLLNQTYYELLRMFSNELEKENSVLFVLGFSFADEHIKEITIRAANTNPTLQIYVVVYDSESKAVLTSNLPLDRIRYNNIKFIEPPKIEEKGSKEMKDEYLYTLQNINSYIFSEILKSIAK